MNYWQIAAGVGDRDYADVFLRFGVALVGPGRHGPFPQHPDKYRERGDWNSRIERLADDVEIGDVVILKRGNGARGQIVAAGRVTKDYEWIEAFGDVEGWDLQHCRRVDWFKANEPIPVVGLARGTLSQVNSAGPREAADGLLSSGVRVVSSDIPSPATSISEEGLVQSLVENGLRPSDAEDVIRAIFHVRRLASWYRTKGQDLSEHEIRTFLIVPILLALGWSEQRIKIEWRRADIALFREVFNRNVETPSPSVIVETKRMGTGLDYAEPQVVRFARDFPECNVLVTSTGERYQLFTKEPGQEWDIVRMEEKHLSAYLNLSSLKGRHPYLVDVGGAPDLLKRLMPGGQ